MIDCQTYDDWDPCGCGYEDQEGNCHVHPWNDEPYPCWECEEDWKQEEDDRWEEEWDDGRISH